MASHLEMNIIHKIEKIISIGFEKIHKGKSANLFIKFLKSLSSKCNMLHIQKKDKQELEHITRKALKYIQTSNRLEIDSCIDQIKHIHHKSLQNKNDEDVLIQKISDTSIQ